MSIPLVGMNTIPFIYGYKTIFGRLKIYLAPGKYILDPGNIYLGLGNYILSPWEIYNLGFGNDIWGLGRTFWV